MGKGNVLITGDVHPVLIDILESNGFTCVNEPKITYNQILNVIKNYVGIIATSRTEVDQNLIEKATQLKFIGRAGSGMENIDVAFAETKGIKCVNSPEGNKDAVAEHAIGLILSWFRNINIADTEVRNKTWKREENRGLELKGKTIGILGYGNTGSAFAEKLSGFGVKILVYDKYKSGYEDKYIAESTLEQIYQEVDILSIHLPLTKETNYWLDDSFFMNFKKDIFLINTARGKIINTFDLVKNIQSGKVLGAALDVLENEDLNSLDTTAQEWFSFLKNSPKVILSPHIAGWTFEAKKKMAEILADKILKLSY